MTSQNEAALNNDDYFDDYAEEYPNNNVTTLAQGGNPIVTEEDLDTRNLITGTLTYRWMESSVNPDAPGEYKVAVAMHNGSVEIISSNYKTRGGWEFPHPAFASGFYKWLAINPIPAPAHPNAILTPEDLTVNIAVNGESDTTVASTENLQHMTFQQLAELPVEAQPVPDITINEALLLNLLKYLFQTQEPDTLGMVSATFGNVSLNTTDMIIQARRNIGVLLNSLINREMINVTHNSISLTFAGSDVAMNGFPESE